MSKDQNIHGPSLTWLILAQFFIVLGFMFEMPSTVALPWFIAVLWRMGVIRGWLGLPPMAVKFALVTLAILTSTVNFSPLYGLEPAAALLIGAMGLKLIELKKERDLHLLILLSYFLIVSRFLFSQSIPVSLYQCFCLLLVTTALAAQHGSQNYITSKALYWFSLPKITLVPLTLSAKILLQALPLMIVFFLVFPRISPFWSVPLPSASTKTGVSDTLSVGSMVKLTQSSELAFRASFADKKIPEQQELYWRGLVLTDFDGESWSQSEQDKVLSDLVYQRKELVLAQADISDSADLYEYNLIMEPSHRNWWFVLPQAYPLPSNSKGDLKNLGYSKAGNVVSRSALVQRTEYRFLSVAQPYFKGVELVDPQITQRPLPFLSRLPYVESRRALRLPNEGNNQARQLAQKWRSESLHDQDIVVKGLQYFAQNPFFYTLEPLPLPQKPSQRIDAFLFDTRSGFCEHYANAFTFLMRSAGVPARIVSGYQGGELNRFESFINVRQYDAHAWVEVWIENLGWVRADPTAMVAPDRVRQPSIDQFETSDAFLSNSLAARFYKLNRLWFASLEQRYAQLNYLWHKSVLNFDREAQANTLKSLLGGMEPWRIAAFLFAAFALVSIPLVTLLLLRERKRYEHKADQHYAVFLSKADKAGTAKTQAETPLVFAQRLKGLYPTLASEIDSITYLYIDLMYQSGAGNTPELLDQLKQQCRSIKFVAMA